MDFVRLRASSGGQVPAGLPNVCCESSSQIADNSSPMMTELLALMTAVMTANMMKMAVMMLLKLITRE